MKTAQNRKKIPRRKDSDFFSQIDSAVVEMIFTNLFVHMEEEVSHQFSELGGCCANAYPDENGEPIINEYDNDDDDGNK